MFAAETLSTESSSDVPKSWLPLRVSTIHLMDEHGGAVSQTAGLEGLVEAFCAQVVKSCCYIWTAHKHASGMSASFIRALRVL